MMRLGRRVRAQGACIAFDTSVPLLVVKVGRYPRDHGALGAIRSLGRVGVPVYAVTEDALTPPALSRYLTGRTVAPSTGLEGNDFLIARLVNIARRVGRPAVALPTDDEAAVLVAEHAHELAQWLVTPDVDATLPRQLASKRGLRALCLAHDVATPGAAFPASREEAEVFATTAMFPVIAKVIAPFERLETPSLRAARILRSAEELVAAAASWSNPSSVMLQEYVPEEVSEDWIFHGYFDARSDCVIGFTGVKYRSWPPYFGATTYARAVANSQLAAESAAFCARIGYCGIVDMDWRLDRRDGRYRLLDCNPRVGAQFRLFENDAGIDVVRALHLDLTDREVPAGRQIDGRGFVVESRDCLAILAYRRFRPSSHAVPHTKGRIERAWFAWDDPLPFVSMAARLLGPLSRRIKLVIHAVRERRSRTGRGAPSARSQ
jgi:predicted ATP-grasp superfamily ATP-dependent carboligase